MLGAGGVRFKPDKKAPTKERAKNTTHLQAGPKGSVRGWCMPLTGVGACVIQTTDIGYDMER